MDIYKRLLRHRLTFKAITQLSWEITNLERKYPLDKIPESQLEGLEALYSVVVDRFNKLAQEHYENQQLDQEGL